MVATSGAGWRLAPCLAEMMQEADHIAPGRSHIADGSIGDAAHATRTSHHNPKGGWVDAVDITHDPGAGWDCEHRTHAILGDRRLEYVIFNRRIWRGYDKPGIPAWTEAVYTGSNTHAHHMHVSVWRDQRRMDTTQWWPVDQGDDEMTDLEFVLLCYTALKLTADRPGVAHWTGLLGSGHSRQQVWELIADADGNPAT